MAWRIEYARTAADQLKKLDKREARRVLDYMEERIAPLSNPRDAGHALKGPLGGLWRYRVGDFRIICEINDSLLRVLVVRVGNRREVYR